MRFFLDDKTKAIRVTVDDSELTKRLVASDHHAELTPVEAKKEFGKTLSAQPDAVKRFLEEATAGGTS